MFEVDGTYVHMYICNMCDDAFQLAMQQMLRCKLQQFVARITSPLVIVIVSNSINLSRFSLFFTGCIYK